MLKQEEYRRKTGEKVAFYRKKAGLTQAQLAHMVPCSSDLISRIERGLQDPTFQIVCSITCCLGITPNDLCPAEVFRMAEITGLRSIADKAGIADASRSGIDTGKAVKLIKEVLREVHPLAYPFVISLEAFIVFCTVPRSRRELMDFCKIKSSSYFRDCILYPLLRKGLLQRTVPEKPSSPLQRYILTIPDEDGEVVETQQMREE